MTTSSKSPSHRNVLDIVEGSAATYTVVLTDEPVADVTVTPSSSDMAVATVTPVR